MKELQPPRNVPSRKKVQALEKQQIKKKTSKLKTELFEIKDSKLDMKIKSDTLLSVAHWQ